MMLRTRFCLLVCVVFFFFNDTATTEIYPLSLHDALPIYECMKAEDPKQPRQPWRFVVDGGEPFAFAGLCTRKEWDDPEDRGFEDGWLYSCTIVTTTPNEVVAPVHDRMPAILPSAEAEAAWLRPDLEVGDAVAMCAPLPASRMEGAPANPKLNKVGKGIEGPELLVAPS